MSTWFRSGAGAVALMLGVSAVAGASDGERLIQQLLGDDALARAEARQLLPREDVETSAETVADLVAELREREERYDLAFSDMSAIRVALDQELCDMDAPLAGVREIAFFPPMTGG